MSLHNTSVAALFNLFLVGLLTTQSDFLPDDYRSENPRSYRPVVGSFANICQRNILRITTAGDTMSLIFTVSANCAGVSGSFCAGSQMSAPIIDVGILTIREDEFLAILQVFPDDHSIYKGRHREYALRTTEAGSGARYRLAILRQVEQGNGEAQEAARDLIDDLQPSLLIVVGIAGGLPSDDISLGDVVLATRVHDFSLEARTFQESSTYNVAGGPIAKCIAAGVANLNAREDELGEWWADLPAKPAVSLSQSKFYGPKMWQRRVRQKMQAHYGKSATPRPPTFRAGPIASSDRLVKDPEVLIPWITTARGILAVEMESSGVHRATRDRTPMLAIRSLSDIVGYKRQEAWTKYACGAAAAFACAYLRTQPVPVRELPESLVGSGIPVITKPPSASEGASESEESFANLLPLRRFPEKIFVGPALCSSHRDGWARLRKGASSRPAPYVSGCWTVYERNLYSFIDPETSPLKRLVDIGGLDQFDSAEWAFSKDENQRRIFVQLLNSALSEDLPGHGVRHHRDQDVYAFIGFPDQEPRRLKYGNLKIRSTMTVVAHYESKDKNGKAYKFLRHTAFHGRFRLLGGEWYLEINPTYRFTRDGKELDRFHEIKLAGIKRLERNRSVLSQLLVWQATLRGPWTRTDRMRLLEFGPLASFRFSSGVDESTLTALDVPATRPSLDRELE